MSFSPSFPTPNNDAALAPFNNPPRAAPVLPPTSPRHTLEYPVLNSMTLPVIFTTCRPRADVLAGTIRDDEFMADLSQIRWSLPDAAEENQET